MTPKPDIVNHRARILIVDDERSNRELLEVMLAPEGFALVFAASGEEALIIVAKERPDLMLLDIMMPGMDGYLVAQTIKGGLDTKRIPIIMVTALDDRHTKMRCLSAGAEDFLTKPVDRTELCLRVKNLLRLKVYGDYFDTYSQLLETEVLSRTADLIESERLYRTTFDAAPVGIVHVGLDGQWLRVNQRLCDLLGYSREDLQSTATRLAIQSEDAGDAEPFRQLAAGTIERHVIEEKQYRRRDGKPVWVRVNMSVHRDATAQLQHFILVIEDITERRILDAQIRQSNKMDSIGRLASGVAHDFNNLLTIILGFAQLLIKQTSLAADQTKDIGEIINAARRAAGLTKQLLAFSRQQVMHAESIDVNTLVTEMIAMLDRLIGANTEIKLTLAPDLSPALMDSGQLEQVVMNLVVNARDAMPEGGTVTIETRNVGLEDSSLIHDETAMQGMFVVVAISDTGCGMSQEIQRHIFEPFYTTKEAGKGTGLGLSTTYGIVKQSKGYLWVHSEIGRGTTFEVYLPRSDRGATPPDNAMVTTVPPRSSGTVLLVEDDAGVRQLATRILDEAGYLVLEAANGNEAEKLYALHADTIDLVVTDVMMHGCGGPELVSRLKVQAPGLKVLYMSGYTEQSAAHSAEIRGLPFVQKPFTVAELQRSVYETLHR